MLSAKRIHRLQQGLLLFIVLLMMVIRVSAQDVPEKKQIMVLHRQWEASDWEMLFNASLFDRFNRDSPQPVSITFEFLALENISDPEHLEDVLSHLKYKASVSPVDLVIAALPSSNTFLLEYGDEIFPGVPRLFVLPSGQDIEAIQAVPQSAIVESASTQALYNTVEAIFTILPDTQRLVVVSGSGVSDDAYLVRAEAAIAELVDPSVQVDYLIGIPLNALPAQISSLPNHTVILFTSYSSDRNQVDYTLAEVVPFITGNAGAPVFGFIDATFGKGIVGGNLTSAKLYAETAAEVGMQLLADPTVSDLSVTEGRTESYYDWRQLRRWNISEDRLPPGSLVEYKTETFWETYKFGILTIIGIIVLQTTLIIALMRVLQLRRQAAAALGESEEKYRTLIEHANDGLIITLDGVVKFANTRLADLLGYTVDEMLNTNTFDYIFPDERDRVKDIARRRLQGEAVPNLYETVLYRKDGQGLEVEMNAGLITYEGKPASMSFIRDITERKYLEAASRNAEILRVQLEKEKEMSNLKARFVTTVSHEFRTPLAIIQTSSGLLSHYYTQLTDERRQQLFQQIDQQVADMTNLMENTLTISQSQDGEVTFNPVEMNIEAFCRGIFEKMQLADKQTHRFELNSYVSKPQVKLDNELVEYILTNLLSNAVKYTPQNGKITLVIDQTVDEVILEVWDEGIGIPEADMPRLFEPFHRASNVGNISGTGLGLAIVRQYVVLHGGQIEAESVIGQGSTFRVILPTNGS